MRDLLVGYKTILENNIGLLSRRIFCEPSSARLKHFVRGLGGYFAEINVDNHILYQK